MINLEEKIVIRLNQLGKYFAYFAGIESKKNQYQSFKCKIK